MSGLLISERFQLNTIIGDVLPQRTYVYVTSGYLCSVTSAVDARLQAPIYYLPRLMFSMSSGKPKTVHTFSTHTVRNQVTRKLRVMLGAPRNVGRLSLSFPPFGGAPSNPRTQTSCEKMPLERWKTGEVLRSGVLWKKRSYCLHEGGRPWYLLHPLLRWRLHSYVCEALFRWQNTTHRAFLDRLAHQVGVSNWRCCNVGWCRDDFRFNHPCKFVHFEQVSGGKVCMYAELPARLFQLSGESGVVHRLLMASAVHHRHVRLSEHSGMQHHARDNGNHDTHTR